MEIIELPLKALKPYKRNPRRNDKAVEYVANSIRQFGFKVPIVIDENYEIVCGHTRWKAAKVIGMESVPCIMADDLNEDQIRAFRLADNKTAEMADWDFDLLEMEFNDIDPELFDMSDFGFFQDDEEPQSAPAEIVEDDAPEPDEVEPCCKRGQVWQLGAHRLMCGDSTDAEDVAWLMDGEKAGLALTDPPYGISAVKGVASDSGGDKAVTIGRAGGGGKLMFGKKSSPPTEPVGGDKIVKAHIYEYIQGDETTETARASYEIMKNFSANQIIFGGNYFTDFLKPSPCWCIWDKQNTGNFADVEMAWTSFSKGAKLYTWLWNGLSRKGDRKTELVSRVHPTQKPVGVLGAILEDFSEKGENILDLFGGSGSTLIACEQLDRRCFMMEISEKYCDVIIKRWENLTGQTAVLAEE